MSNGLRREIVSALKRRDYDGLIGLWIRHHQVIRILISMTYDKKDIIAWRAMEAIGHITKAMSRENPEDVRNLAGRLLWMMRDESGGIGWSAPEILGEIIRNNPELCSDLVPVLMSFHEEQMLRAGVLWAAGRIAEAHRELVLSAMPMIVSYLDDPVPYVRGMAVWALSKMKVRGHEAPLRGLISDTGVMIIYDDGEFRERTIGELAQIASEA
jgi:HEAT repeat protein